MKKSLVALLMLCAFMHSYTLPAQNHRNQVIEYTTSTQCGGCPCLDSVLQEIVLVHHPETVILAYHTAWSHFGTYHGQALSDSLNSAGGDPQAHIDRTISNVEGFNAFVDSVNARYVSAQESPVRLEISSKTYDPESRLLSVTFHATSLADTLNGLFRVSYMITEGNIMFQQAHHPPCSGGPNYIHFNVVRNVVNDVYGDTLVNGSWGQNISLPVTFSTTLDSSWVDHNCDIVIMVYKQTAVQLGKIYGYRIQQGIRQTVTAPLGVSQHNTENIPALAIFPNPASSQTNFHIKLQNRTHADVSIYTLDGKMVLNLLNKELQKGEYNLELNTESLKKGIYQCILKTEDGTDNRKLVII